MQRKAGPSWLLHDWLQQTRLRAAPNSATTKAIDYSLKRWTALTRYAETSDLPIENGIRPIALGKKNWLFAGSERSGKRAAVIQTLLGTAKLDVVRLDAYRPVIMLSPL